MVIPGLVFLRWKIEVHAWLEAMWEGRWFGIALTSLCVAACIYLQWKIPEPGVSVAAMGVTAALMTARTKASGPEKVVWMLIITSLLLSEVLAIRKDHRENNQQMAKLLNEEVTARGEAKTNFQGIGEGIKAQSRLSQQQFDQTLEQQSQHFDATMAKEQTGINEITGGDSYAIVYPNLASNEKNVFPLVATLCQKCRYSIPSARISVQAGPFAASTGHTNYDGSIDSSTFGITIPANINPSVTGESVYTIMVFARNKPTRETLTVKYDIQWKEWQFRWHIVREEKNPLVNPKTNMAEGGEVTVLEDSGWRTIGIFQVDPNKTKVIPKPPS